MKSLKALVVQSAAGCSMCGHARKTLYHVTVESIEQQNGIGWKLRGNGKVLTQCPICASIYKVVRTEIPIECSGYDCPDCGESQNLDYKVKRIDTAGSEFKFEAEISCPKCQRKKTFVQHLKDLLKLKKLEIKLTGISVER